MNGDYLYNYVLDAYAVICYLEDEAGANEVASLLKKAGVKKIRLLITWINMVEVYYQVFRKYGELDADKVLNIVKSWPVKILAGDEELTLASARVKAAHALSYADAFAVGAALKYNAAVVTGDPEIKDASDKIGFPLLWLGSANQRET